MSDKLSPIHPGEVLLEEFLKPMKLSQNYLAINLANSGTFTWTPLPSIDNATLRVPLLLSVRLVTPSLLARPMVENSLPVKVIVCPKALVLFVALIVSGAGVIEIDPNAKVIV